MNKMTRLNACLLAALSLGAAGANATDWQYFGAFDANNGKPKDMIDLTGEFPADLIELVHKKLPEGLNISKNDSDLITDDLGANLYFVEDAEVSIAFLHEGAGFLNSVGMFTFDPRNKPKSAKEFYDPNSAGRFNHRILFPNFSAQNSGGALKAGDGLYLGKVKAGSAMGFSILANAWKSGRVDPNQSASDIFYTIKALNPEKADKKNLNAHTVLLAKPDDKIVALGFEDINRERSNSDHDFNDVVMVIKVTPFEALDRSHVNAIDEVVDTDRDGVPDATDAFPTDPTRASRTFYPSATGYGYLAFEDNWPQKGDYDMNDWVVAYRVAEIRNAANQVTDIQLTYEVEARGAAFDNAFAIHLPGVPSAAIKTVNADGSPATKIRVNDADATPLATEAGQSEVVLNLVPSTVGITKTSGGCVFFNTRMECPRQSPVRIVADIAFQTPQASVGTPPYNPFLFRANSRGLEIHLVDHPPTAKANMALFGTADDASDPAKGRYYRSKKNLPWALDIPDTWQHPVEYADIGTGYLSFDEWVQSAGQKSADWYAKSKNPKALYTKP